MLFFAEIWIVPWLPESLRKFDASREAALYEVA